MAAAAEGFDWDEREAKCSRLKRANIIKKVTIREVKQPIDQGRGGGHVVRMLAFYSDNPSSNPLMPSVFSAKFVFEKNKNKQQKEAGGGALFFKKLIDLRDDSPPSQVSNPAFKCKFWHKLILSTLLCYIIPTLNQQGTLFINTFAL